MYEQHQWLFEAPFTQKDLESNQQWLFELPYTNQEYYNSPSEADAMFDWARKKWEEWKKSRTPAPLPSPPSPSPPVPGFPPPSPRPRKDSVFGKPEAGKSTTTQSSGQPTTSSSSGATQQPKPARMIWLYHYSPTNQVSSIPPNTWWTTLNTLKAEQAVRNTGAVSVVRYRIAINISTDDNRFQSQVDRGGTNTTSKHLDSKASTHWKNVQPIPVNPSMFQELVNV